MQEFDPGLEWLAECPNCHLAFAGKVKSIRSRLSRSDRIILAALGLPSQPSQWSLCTNCGLLFLNPRFRPSLAARLYGEEDVYRQADIDAFGSFRAMAKAIDSTIDAQEVDLKHNRHSINIQWFAQILDLDPNRTLIVDVGAGWGSAQPIAHLLGFHYVGIESSPACLQFASELGRSVTASDLNNLRIPEDAETLVLYLSQTLEHIPEPSEWLSVLIRGMQQHLCHGKFRRAFLYVDVPTWDVFHSTSLVEPHMPLQCANWGHYNHFGRVSLCNTFVLAGTGPVKFQLRRGDVRGVASIPRSRSNGAVTLIKPRNFRLLMARILGPALANVVRPTRQLARIILR